MRVIFIGIVLFYVMGLTAPTCVLESEFGFILNCNFKKSGLFRVRNLGGLKAHFGLGFSFGDELGFAESLGNLEGNRRRALNYKTGFINKVGVVSPRIDSSTTAPSQSHHVQNLKRNVSSMTEVMFLPLGVPTFRPMPSNLVRRNDIILTEGTSNNRMTNFYYIPENAKDQATVTNFSAQTDNKNSFVKKQNELKNENSIQSKVNDALVQQTNITNQIQSHPIEEIGSKYIASSKHNPNLGKISSKSSRVQGSKTMAVMNAPKEYYPSGYDKNFDDNFTTKVDLPPTTFTCTEQKYFPGLYANMDLDCMVFHVCAITEGGIIMKSFLCPESTLFDQSILKCNWWFYVDCNNSIYDSNLPISKSYQLMKSLSYFSNFTKVDKEYKQKNVINKN